MVGCRASLDNNRTGRHKVARLPTAHFRGGPTAPLRALAAANLVFEKDSNSVRTVTRMRLGIEQFGRLYKPLKGYFTLFGEFGYAKRGRGGGEREVRSRGGGG